MLQRRRKSVIAAVAMACSLLLALPALAESNVRIVRLSFIDGDAQVNTGGQDSDFTHAVLNMPVTAGMWVYTPKGGRAEVQFENGSTVRLANDAEVQFRKLALADSGGKINIIRVDHGVVYFNFDKVKSDDNIAIEVGGKTLKVDKSSHLRIDATDKENKIAMFKGDATIDATNPLELKSNETLSFKDDTVDTLKVAKGTERIGSDGWDKDRSNEVLIAASTPSRNGYAYPDAYAAQFATLGMYGNYYNVGGATFWQPFGMGMGWNPYMDGMWGFYPGFGYTWISSYPWGWGPYRYGNWGYLPVYGWVWYPGTNFNSWNVGPRFTTVPQNFHAPVAPTAGVKTASLVVVGHPPNVHPAILAGRADVGARPNGSAGLSHAMVTPPAPMARGGAMAGGRPASGGTRPSAAGSMRPAPAPSASSTSGHVATGGGIRPH